MATTNGVGGSGLSSEFDFAKFEARQDARLAQTERLSASSDKYDAKMETLQAENAVNQKNKSAINQIIQAMAQ